MVALALSVAAPGSARARAAAGSERVAQPPSSASDDAAPAAADPADDGALAKARELFDRGAAYYEASQFEQAVELWVQAYAALDPTAANAKVRAEIVFNISRAQQRWFEIDRDVKHLRQAELSLRAFAREIPAVYPADAAAAEQARVDAELATLARAVEEHEQQLREQDAAAREATRPRIDPEADAAARRRNRALLWSGGGLTGVGAIVAGVGVGLGVAAADDASAQVAASESLADLPQRRAALDDGEAADRLIVLSSVIGGSVALVGIPLAITGATLEARRRKLGGAGARASWSVAPIAGLHTRGVAVRLRF
jgi:tetratricopeptide (TPR) repeat protein